MASIANDPNGRRRILFTDGDRTRKTIRLGKVSQRHAEAVKYKVEDLVSAKLAGHAPSDETSRWLMQLDDALYGRLARVGLVKPRETALLGPFTRHYIDGRADIKPRTRINLERARSYLLEVFAEDTSMRDITAGDAEDFRQHMVRTGRAENTTRRAIGRARQFFTAAVKRGLIASNPFAGLSASISGGMDRFHFISRADAERVLEACPNVEWRAIFALARFGGLRCPSEVLALRWADIDWANGRIRVPSPKTAGQGKPARIIPLFPELRPILLDAFALAEDGAEHIISRTRDTSVNLRTQLHRIISKAGLEPWPKAFQNLRSTRETELAETFPMHVVCQWIGNTQPVAARHYLQLTDEHFTRALSEPAEPAEADAKAAQNAAQHAHASSRTARTSASAEHQKTPIKTGVCGSMHDDAQTFKNEEVPCVGLEPTTR